MSPETVRCFGLMLACQARIDGMKAANSAVDPIADHLPYGELHFYAEAANLEHLAMEVIKQ